MKPLLDQSESELPETYRQWLINPLPKSVTYLPMDPELGFAIFLLPLLWLPLIVFGFDFLWRYSQGMRGDQGDLISGLVVCVPLAIWSALHFRKRLQDHKKLKLGIYKIGVFCDGKTLLWCESFKYCHLFSLNTIKRFSVTAVPVHRVGWRPENFVISGDGFSLEITNVAAYGLPQVYDLITTWDANIHFDLDSRLDEYFAKLRGCRSMLQTSIPKTKSLSVPPDEAPPVEGILLDLLLLVLWMVALPSASAWCLTHPHLSVWLVALLQVGAVGRGVSLFLETRSRPDPLGSFAPVGMLCAILAAGAFTWFLGAMFASPVNWGFWTKQMPIALVFATLGAVGLLMDSVDGERSPAVRFLDAALVVAYLFAAEAFLFAMLGGADDRDRLATVIALVLCHLPMRLLFAIVPPTSRYELLSASAAFVWLLWDVLQRD